MSKPKAKSLADFRAVHDKNVIVPNKIRGALAEMEKEGGPENWEYEADFFKRAGISTSDGANFRDQFEKHVVKTPSTNGNRSRLVWVASVKAAEKFKL